MTRALEADLATVTDAVGIAPRTAVGIPPSDIDPLWDEMRVAVNGPIIYRAFDPGAPIVTGAPIGLLTESGEQLVAEDDEPLTTEVGS